MQIRGGSPNLINGVSRQPHEVRLTSQLEESVNQFPTVTRGLVPRNPAKLRGVVHGALPANSTVHMIDRDDNERYVVTVSPEGIQVHDLEGNPRTVNTPNGWAYLAGAQSGDLEALTVADHTFIVNKKKVVLEDAVTSDPYQNGGLVHIAAGDYHTAYEITVNGSVAARYVSDGGPYGTEADARKAERGARTGVIASRLYNNSVPSGVGETLPASATSDLVSSLGASGYSFSLLDSVIYIRRSDHIPFTLDVKAGSETRARAHKDTVQDFSELPRRAPHGFSIRVSGSEDSAYDDYYVRFDHPEGAAQGRWKETVAPDIPYRINASTMPHILVREADGTFTFKEAKWADREVGDLDTNPWPSFVGHTINGMVFYKNRVGFISGEAVAMSRHGDFFNFFIESVLTPLDTDPVDVAISYPEISNIRHAVPFSGEMVMFTSSVPFRLASGELFTPKTANFEHLLTNRVSAQVRPVTAGSRLYFVNDAPSGCFVHEFTYDREVGLKEAPTITDHVHGYIPSGVTMMEAEDDLNILVLVSENEPNAIYVYKWLWVGADKAQSAWQKWIVPDPIVGIKFFDEELVLVTSRSSTRELLAINCHEAWTDNKPFPVYLDRRVEVLGSYSSYNDRTTFSLPVAAEGAKIVFRDGDDFGFQPQDPISYSGQTLTLPGNHAKWAYVGWEYESYGVLSDLLYRPTNNQGGYGNAEAGWVTTVANVAFDTDRTAFLDVVLSREYRKPYTYSFSAALTGTKTAVLGKVVVGEIRKNISVMSKAEDFTLKFSNNGPYPYAIMSFQWTGKADRISY